MTSSSPAAASPPAARDNPAFDALCTRLVASLRAQADPRTLLHDARNQLHAASWQAWLNYARAFSQVGVPALAIALLGEANQRWPGHPELGVGLGNALRMLQRVADAEQQFREVLQAHPQHAPAAMSLAFLLRDSGRVDAGCAVVLDLWQRQGKDVAATLKTGTFLETCRRPALAAQVYQQAVAAGARDPRIRASAGNVANLLGQFEHGREQLLAALDDGLDLQDWSGVLLSLANGQRYASADHPDFARFQRAWDDPAHGEQARISAGFALGKARVDIDDIEGAVDVLRQANAMHHRMHPWPASRLREFVATQLSAPLPPPIVPVAACNDIVPVFVVGLPRTGTTLVESMLARHTQVRGRGEMDWLPFLAFELSAQQRGNDPAALGQAAALYLAHLRQDDAPARWYIDKNPHNFRHLGLIASLFPQARIIHCVRDRRDTAVSIWSQLFAHRDVDYAYAMDDIATFAQGHDQLMAHWRDRLELPVFEIAYERLVEQPAEMLQELGNFLGLPAQDLLQSTSADGSSIATASVWQARQPIHRGAVGRWRKFAPYLPELTASFASD